MPDEPTPPAREHEREFPDVIAEFAGASPAVGYDDEPDDTDRDDSDDVDLECECGGASIEYHCTRRELREAGYGGGFSEHALDEMPEHDSEFMAPAVATDPMVYTEPPHASRLRALLDSVERWDWTDLSCLHRLAGALTSEYMDTALFEIGL